PPPPKRLNRAIPAELETIVLKAMNKAPEERYGTAQELADDLRRFLEDRPIQAKRPTLRQWAAKWGRRHKGIVRTAGVVAVLAVAALAVSTALIWGAQQDLNQANADLNQANDNLKQALERERHNGYVQRIALAEREWAAHNLHRMQQLLDDCPADLPGWEWRWPRRLRYKPLPPLRNDGPASSAVFSPDREGRRIASADHEGWVKIWDAQTGEAIAC